MGPNALKFFHSLARKNLTKNQGSGITTIPNRMTSESEAAAMVQTIVDSGLPLEKFDQFIRSEADVLKYLNIIKNANKPRVIPGTSAEGKAITEKLFGKKGEVVDFPQKRSFKEEIDAMKKSGDLVDEKDMVISDKITDREMFKNSNLNKPTVEGQMDKINAAMNRIKEIQKEQAAMYKPKVDTVEETVTYIKTLEPMTALKEANLVISRKGKYKDLTPDESKKILQDTEDHIFERDIPDEDFATGGRAGFQQGGLPAIDSRMNLDYDTLVEQNTDPMLQALKAQNKSSYTAPAPNSSLPPVSELNKIPTNQPGSLEEYLSGYEKYKSTNPNTYTGLQALINATLPGGIDYTFTSGSHANHFNDYLKSIGLSPYQKNLNSITEKFNKGGRAGFYTGGITDVEPSLDDIGHGADALNARTRLMSPGNQATTSTGLNYLLAEDNDNMRIPFSAGGGGRRAFLKFIASIGGLTAAAKSGILGLGEGTGKKAVTETIKQSAGSGTPPPYFFKLVEKIKTMGDDTIASKDKAIAKKYKDYYMEEDFAGNISITRRGDMDAPGYEEVYMGYSVDDVPLKGKKGSTKVEEYEEYTVRPDEDGKMKDVEDGVPDDVVEEGTMFEDTMTEFGKTKKADGGRIGFSGGNLAKLLAGKKITSSSGRFLEKIFGKGSLNEISRRDPEMHRGLLEVVEMFRNRDNAGLIEYMQNFLPHMSKKEIQAFIKGDAVDAAGQGKYGLGDIQGQLIRLGSGRDYKGKLEAMKKLDNAQKLDTLDVTEEMIRKPNASGGIQTMLGE